MLRSLCSLRSDLSLMIESTQGRNGNIFLRGQINFSWFFPGVKCFFPVENFHFCWTQKRPGSLPFLTFSHYSFSIIHLPFLNFPSFLLNFPLHLFFPIFMIRLRRGWNCFHIKRGGFNFFFFFFFFLTWRFFIRSSLGDIFWTVL